MIVGPQLPSQRVGRQVRPLSLVIATLDPGRQLVRGEDVATAREQTRGFEATDAHERHRELVEQGSGAPHLSS